MKLQKARIQNFRSIEDTGEFEISELCCLVGKNEAGKSAILDALCGVNPYRSYKYDKIRDYPRRFLSKYEERHGKDEAEIAKTWWKLDVEDIEAVNSVLGNEVLNSDSICVTSGYGPVNTWEISVNEKKCVEDVLKGARLNAVEKAQVTGVSTTAGMLEKLEKITAPSEKLISIKKQFSHYRKGRATLQAIDILSKRMPKFFLTSHFDRMSGEISLDNLKEAKRLDEVTRGDQIFLDFIEYAGTSIEELNDSEKYEEQKAICEGASNDITDEIFQFWSQNDAISVKIEIGEGKPADPAPMNSGTVAKIRIWNENHRASIPLNERSAGFVWFFSFLSQFKQLSKHVGDVILLLDEPGLTLHGKAQSDLLLYIKERLLKGHQVIYTTHSPFLVPANQLGDVRVVEDVVKYKEDSRRPEIFGTKVSSEVLSVNKDTLFPLRGHLGYEISHSLFIGQNTLLVEGPSDILYLQVVSNELKSRNRVALDPRWVVCPSGGIDKVFAFVSLFVGNNLNVAVLTDFAHGDKGKIARLRNSELLKSSQIFTTSDFLDTPESDVEDFFHPSIMIQLVNSAFEIPAEFALSTDSVGSQDGVRIVKKIEAAYRTIGAELPEFDHFRPSSYLLRNPELLNGDSSEVLHTLNIFEKVFTVLNDLIEK